MSQDTRLVWIDLDNSPHVPFFRPIIAQLRQRGYSVLVTARDAYNVTDLLQLYGIDCTTVGRHYGKHKAMKVIGLGIRAAQLLPLVAKHRPHLAVSHGSRAQTLVGKVMRIPSMVIADYEHVTHVTRPDYMVLPEVIPVEPGGKFSEKTYQYPGIKEDVYAATFAPDASIKHELGLQEADIVVTFRPPASEAHYHSPLSDELSTAALESLRQDARTKVVLLPRNEQQKSEIRSKYPELIESGKLIIPSRAVDGLNLVWHSDLVISGGGTMNREAAALGVPVYSTFRGPIGAVDRYLAAKGRLVLLESVDDVRHKIALVKRPRGAERAAVNHSALESILGHIETAVRPRLPATSPIRKNHA